MSSLRDLLNKSKERKLEAGTVRNSPLAADVGNNLGTTNAPPTIAEKLSAIPMPTKKIPAFLSRARGNFDKGFTDEKAPLSLGGKVIPPGQPPIAPEPDAEMAATALFKQNYEAIKEQPRGIAPPALPVQDLGNDTLEKLRENLEYLANNIEHRAQVKQVVQTIMAQIIRNPQFKSGMNNGDFDLIVRGARASYEFAARRKTEGKTAKTAKSGQAAELMQMLKDSGIDLKLEDE